MSAMEKQLLLLTAALVLFTAVPGNLFGNEQCETQVDCDCHNISSNLDQFCDATLNPQNWGEMSGCDVDATGVNYSVSWCPLFIRNSTCLPKMKLRINFFELVKPAKVLDEGKADVEAYIPGFIHPIFNKSYDETCEKVREKMKDLVPLTIKCPFTFTDVISIIKIFTGKPQTVPNPLPTIVPAGSYHLLANITNTDGMFMCVNGWLEFGV